MTSNDTAEDRADSLLVSQAFDRLTGRRGEPVRYALMEDTPVGRLGLAALSTGLQRLEFVVGEDPFVERLLALFPDRPVERSHGLDAVRRELERYFTGRRLTFETRVDLSGLTPFQQKVLGETVKVPAGRYTTYSELAARAGRPRAARAAGNALHDNPVAIIVPCHRVLRGDGTLGGYAGGLPAKSWLLRHEGVLL
jgi:methylated-DNA-[protein]-cysteine S-methyltransferase